MKTSDIIPVTSYEPEFHAWVEAAEGSAAGRRQSVIAELRAEHHILDGVLAAIEREARRLSVHGELRPDFWEHVVDYIGNFTYQIHRRKEEQSIFPALMASEAVDEAGTIAILAKEHAQARELTMALVDGVSDGDWEKVLRAAHVYLRMARDHLEREEHDIFDRVERFVDEAGMTKLREEFDAIELEALGDRSRMYYLGVARRLCVDAGLTDILDH